MDRAEAHAVRKDTASAASLSHGVLTVAMISLSQRGGATHLSQSRPEVFTPHLRSFFFKSEFVFRVHDTATVPESVRWTSRRPRDIL